MPEVIYGPRPMRYEVQWVGASGNWWHFRYYRRRSVAIMVAFLYFGPTRVIDHEPDVGGCEGSKET